MNNENICHQIHRTVETEETHLFLPTKKDTIKVQYTELLNKIKNSNRMVTKSSLKGPYDSTTDVCLH